MQHLSTFKIVFLLLFASSFLLLNSCIKGKGSIVEQQISIQDNFTGVKSLGPFDVVVVLGTAQSVIAKGQQNIINRLIATVNSNDQLELELEQGNYRDFELTVFVTVPASKYFGLTGTGDMTVIQSEGLLLDSLELFNSGGGNIKGLGDFLIDGEVSVKNSGSGDINLNFTCGQLTADISGSGDLNFDFEAGEINSQLSGSGNYNLSGFSPTQNITHSGSGTYRSFYVNSSIVTLNNSGSGDAECRVSSQFNVNISGSGDVYYKGNPQINSSITGTGSLIDSN